MASVYLAGKIDASELTLDKFALELEGRGHQLEVKWWQLGRLPKPYINHKQVNAPAAQSMIAAARACQVFILFPGDNILGAAIELGAALASVSEMPTKKVVVVSPAKFRQSVFYAHPSVITLKNLDEVRIMTWY